MIIDNFSKDGYLIIKKAISPQLVKLIQVKILEKLDQKRGKNTNNKYENFCRIIKESRKRNFELIKPANDFLIYKNLYDKILLEEKILKTLINLIGPDLCFINDTTLVLNIPKQDSPKKNYFFKDWHQEIWSGANVSSLMLWSPIFHKNSKAGQIELINNSHTWGHVPHKNRSPIKLPKKFKTTKLNLELGDVIIFSTLLLHRSLSAAHTRLAFTTTVKNFKYKNYSFDDNRNWKIFMTSQLTKIEQKLGNHYLSPFRTLDEDLD